MKGVFLVVMMIAMLIVTFLVVKNFSTHESLEGSAYQMKTMDRAKETVRQANQQTEEMQKKLNRVFEE